MSISCPPMTVFYRLESLLLSENFIASIKPPVRKELQLTSITTVVLDCNPINEWTSIDALSAWLPNLSSLRVVDTSLSTGMLSKVV